MRAGAGRRRRVGDRAGDPCVDDGDRRAHRTCQDVDRGATAQEVGDHLRRHLGRVCRHALADDAVVSRRDDDRPATVGGGRIARDAGELDGEPLEAPEAAGRLRQGVEAGDRPGDRVGVERAERPDPVDGLLHGGRMAGHRFPSFSVTGRPATNRYASSASAASR